MDGPGKKAAAAAVFLLAARLAFIDQAGPFWGVNSLRYLAWYRVLAWTALGLTCLVPFAFPDRFHKTWESGKRDFPAWAAGLVFFIVTFLHPKIGVPLLGDGVDRVEATLAGFKSLRDQPAPLDMIFHILLYKAGLFSRQASWDAAWLTWRQSTPIAAGLAFAALWKLASLRAVNSGERWFLVIATLCAGTFIYFFGYVENYVFLAAGVYVLLLAVELFARGKIRGWVLAAVFIVSIGLHYFMVLALPALFYSMIRGGAWRPNKKILAAAGLALAAFGVFVVGILDDHYGGPAKIFVKPGAIFSAYHLAGFLNQILLSSPAMLLTLPLALLFGSGEGKVEKEKQTDALILFAGAASLTMLVFFFFLRPVIGPALDWDLFSTPSLFFTPWMALKIQSQLKGKRLMAQVGWPVMAFAMAAAGPWLSINVNEVAAIQRYEELMEWEAKHNPWAASYGYIRFGKYMGRRPWERNNPKIVSSLENAARVNPDSATVRYQVAMTLKGLGKEELAKKHMAMHHQLMGDYYFKKEQWDAALAGYLKSLSFNPENDYALEKIIMLYQGPLKDDGKLEYYKARLKDCRGGREGTGSPVSPPGNDE